MWEFSQPSLQESGTGGGEDGGVRRMKLMEGERKGGDRDRIRGRERENHGELFQWRKKDKYSNEETVVFFSIVKFHV
jgi:hypothetical protein